MDKSILVFGTILAGFVTGAFSYFNLVNSKEQKVSEFRQNWIDAFRRELTTLVSSVVYISFYYSANKSSKATDIEESYKDYVSSCAALITRINAQEKNIETKYINSIFLENLDDVRNALNEGEYFKINILTRYLVESSKPLLKSEWVRVKSGEKAYRNTKQIALLLCFIAFFVSMFILKSVAKV